MSRRLIIEFGLSLVLFCEFALCQEANGKSNESRLPPDKKGHFRGYLSFMLLCEPDSYCVPVETKAAIIKCFETGQSTAALYLYKQCTAQGTATCEDNAITKTIRSCLRLQSASGNLITEASRQCIREKVTLGHIDCYKINAKLRERGQQYWGSRRPPAPLPFSNQNPNHNPVPGLLGVPPLRHEFTTVLPTHQPPFNQLPNSQFIPNPQYNPALANPNQNPAFANPNPNQSPNQNPIPNQYPQIAQQYPPAHGFPQQIGAHPIYPLAPPLPPQHGGGSDDYVDDYDYDEDGTTKRPKRRRPTNSKRNRNKTKRRGGSGNNRRSTTSTTPATEEPNNPDDGPGDYEDDVEGVGS